MTSIRRIAATLAFAFTLLLIALPDASAVGPGKMCAGIIGIRCDAGLLCEFSRGTCGAGDASGTCTRVPDICTMIFRPVCGCDGKTYSNDCQRQHASVSKKHDGKCKA